VKHFTVLLALDKHGMVLSRLDCLPRHALAGMDLTAGMCAGPDCHEQRRRAALWLLMDARRRKVRGVVGYAVVSAVTTHEADGKPRYTAAYCFKVPRSGFASGGTPPMHWWALAHHLNLVAPTPKTRARRRKRA